MGSKHQKHRRSGRKARKRRNEQRATSDASALTTLPASSAYNIVGGIAPESFAMPTRSSSSIASMASSKSGTPYHHDVEANDATEGISSDYSSGYDVQAQQDVDCASSLRSTHTTISSDPIFRIQSDPLHERQPDHESADTTVLKSSVTNSRIYDATQATAGGISEEVIEEDDHGRPNTSEHLPRADTSVLSATAEITERLPANESDCMSNEIASFSSSPTVPRYATAPYTQNASDSEIRLLVLGQPLNTFSIEYITWALSLVPELYETEILDACMVRTAPNKNEVEPTSCRLPSTVASTHPHKANISRGEWALVPYGRTSLQCPIEQGEDVFDSAETSEASFDSTWSLERVFLASMDGIISCIDLERQLYNVRVIDETASDFDSIASPVKTDLRLLSPKKTGDTPSKYSDIENSFQGDDRSERFQGDIQDFDDTEAQDHHAVFHGFSSFGTIHDLIIEPSSESLSTEECDAPSADTSASETKEDQNVMDRVCICTETTTEPEAEGCPSVKAPLPESDEEEDIPLATTTVDDTPEHMENAPKGAADWAAELTRTLLGTESLFTFFNVLDVDDKDNNKTSKQAVVTAFLKLVNFERQKRGDTLLPRSCTASTIMASKILPHTTLLGTTTLAAFLAELPFDFNGASSVVGLYIAFKHLSSNELRTYDIATTGIMGALGRALGKLV